MTGGFPITCVCVSTIEDVRGEGRWVEWEGERGTVYF